MLFVMATHLFCVRQWREKTHYYMHYYMQLKPFTGTTTGETHTCTIVKINPHFMSYLYANMMTCDTFRCLNMQIEIHVNRGVTRDFGALGKKISH